MLWIVLAAVVVGLVLLAGARKQRKNSTRDLGKGDGHAGSARYKNRGSTRRDPKIN